MNVSAKNLRGRLLLFTAVCFAGGTGFTIAARAQTSTASAPVVVPGDGTPAGETPYEIQKVRIHYQKLLLKEKDIPNAVTELGQKDIQATNPVTGSIQTLLNRAPNVVAYSQQSGQDGTTLAIRGVRNDELAETLDGVPINDLLDGSGDYNENAIGSGLRHHRRHHCLHHQTADG
jgi:iron complex outermembrane receptor protein